MRRFGISISREAFTGGNELDFPRSRTTNASPGKMHINISKMAEIKTVDVLTPKVFIGFILGAMLPYWFSAMITKSVGSAALIGLLAGALVSGVQELICQELNLPFINLPILGAQPHNSGTSGSHEQAAGAGGSQAQARNISSTETTTYNLKVGWMYGSVTEDILT